MAETSVLSLPVLEVHGTFSRASLPDLRDAVQRMEVAAYQLDLVVKRIRVRGGDATVAVDVVAMMTSQIQGLERELLQAARALEGRL